jgi:hypothetical protein
VNDDLPPFHKRRKKLLAAIKESKKGHLDLGLLSLKRPRYQNLAPPKRRQRKLSLLSLSRRRTPCHWLFVFRLVGCRGRRPPLSLSQCRQWPIVSPLSLRRVVRLRMRNKALAIRKSEQSPLGLGKAPPFALTTLFAKSQREQ